MKTATTIRGKRTDEAMVLSAFASPLGPLVAGATAAGVCLLEFSEPGRRVSPAKRQDGAHEHLAQLEQELDEYFAGVRRGFTVTPDLAGTPFQRRVWDALCAIPYGETRSYEDVATAIGQPRAVRAVGTANGRNRIAIVIPCHRVIAKGGGIGGYGGGLDRKQYLLTLERGAR